MTTPLSLSDILLTRTDTQGYIDHIKEMLVMSLSPEDAALAVALLEKMHADMWDGKIPGITPHTIQ